MLLRWRNSGSSRTSTGFPASGLFRGSVGCSVTRRPCVSRSSGAEKNGLWRLRSKLSQSLRQAPPPRPRSLLWRQAGLSVLLPAPGPVFTVREREERTARLVGRQSAVHQAVRLLRRPTLPADHGQGSGRGTLPGLACRQGVGQAVHARAVAPGRQPRSASDRDRRDRHRQGAPVPNRGQRSGAWPGHLVRRQGSFRSEPGRVLHLAWPGKMRKNTLGGHGHVEGVPQFHPQGRECSAGHDPVRQVPCPDASERSHGQGPQARIRAVVGQRPPVYQGAKVHAVVPLGQPLHGGEGSGSGCCSKPTRD